MTNKLNWEILTKKICNIFGFHWKIWFLGGGSQKINILGGIAYKGRRGGLNI